jgi:Mediator of RNA polymerase II transcription subunit 1
MLPTNSSIPLTYMLQHRCLIPNLFLSFVNTHPLLIRRTKSGHCLLMCCFSCSLHKQADQSTQQIIDALRRWPSSRYGEDIPLNSISIVDWCVLRLETWGKSVGMETFVDSGREGGITVVLGGKVLVVDVDLSVDKTDALQPNVQVSSVKTSYAVSNASSGSTSDAGNSTSLDALLHGTIERFYVEVQKAESIRNSEDAARFGMNILEQLRYLVMLDKLAAGKEDGGLRWFADVDQLCPILEGFAKSEADAVAL